MPPREDHYYDRRQILTTEALASRRGQAVDLWFTEESRPALKRLFRDQAVNGTRLPKLLIGSAIECRVESEGGRAAIVLPLKEGEMARIELEDDRAVESLLLYARNRIQHTFDDERVIVHQREEDGWGNEEGLARPIRGTNGAEYPNVIRGWLWRLMTMDRQQQY